jgi:murein DD-endopeptidase MepM/ murein hydrolase activator NlpD
MSRFRSRRHRRRFRLWIAVVATASLVPAVAPVPVAARQGSSPPATSDAVSLRFSPPVDALVVDGWRPPAGPYAPGNRGWEYDTVDAAAVAAAGAGQVRFAGPVGGSHAVTVAHGGGLETTYSLLTGVEVAAGRQVSAGQTIGTAGERMHFGVRLRGDYVDPAVLFRPGALRVGARLLAPSGRRRRSATLSGRPTSRWARAVEPTGSRHEYVHLAPGPPTVATRAGPGTSNRWEGRQWPLSA